MDSSFDRFYLTAGIEAIEQTLREDAERLFSSLHSRGGGRCGYRWGRTQGKIGFHGGKVAVHRPRVRSFDGEEMALPTWTAAQAEDWLGHWAMNLMLFNVSTRACAGVGPSPFCPAFALMGFGGHPRRPQ